jgi:microcin C transport system permease protein
MVAYIIRRLLLIVPTLIGIMVINFVIINVAPGGPIEQLIANLRGEGGGITERVGATEGREVRGEREPGSTQGSQAEQSRAGRGLDPELLKKLRAQLHLDKPMGERFVLMMRNYVLFDFGESFFKGRPVVDLVLEKLPVSISLGLWTTLLIYLISIPLGVAKAMRDGTRFDMWSSSVIIVGYAIPGFLFALMLIIFFSTGEFLRWFPLRGLVSDNWSQLPLGAKVADYFWHIALPVLAMVIGGFATLTFLTKNSFVDEIRKQYVVTARAKGLAERRVLYGHVFRNAMLIVIAGFPGAFIGIFFAGSLLIEVIFSLDGLGLLGIESLINRDYPVVFASLYFFSLIGLLMRLISDLTYVLVDPRIDFEARTA